MTIDVPIGSRPSEKAEAAASEEKPEHARLGVKVENIDPNSARQMNLPYTSGVVVTDVQSGSPADDGGVQPGDVIREVNHRPIKNVSDLQSTVDNLKKGSSVLLNVIRDGRTFYLAFDLS
jgi:S1-C subfamily serine protease